MKTVGDAIKALLASLNHPVYWVATPATTLTYPYFLVWPSTATPGPDETLEGVNTHVSGLYGLTSVGQTVGAAAIAADLARALLGATHPVDLGIEGRQSSIRWVSFGTSSEDTDVALPGTNTHPGIYVDLYRVDVA